MPDLFESIGSPSKPRAYRALVGGSWIDAADGEVLPIFSPVDGSLVGAVPALGEAEVRRAVDAAADAQPAWADLTLDQRASVLLRAADLVDRNADRFTSLLATEIAKPRKDAQEEISRTAALIRFFADEGRLACGALLFGDGFRGYSKDKIAMVYREPVGVVLAITPFNYPLAIPASKVAPALIAGNTVVVKPATQGAISALHMAELFRQAGVPAGVLNIVTGASSKIGDGLVGHPRVSLVAFTGSTDVGRRVAQAAGTIPLQMELSGKDAAIVLADADVALAAREIVASAFAYAGQRCPAVKLVLAVGDIADVLIGSMVTLVARLVVGDPRQDGVDVPPLISDAAADRVQLFLEDAVRRGAKVVCGGERNGRFVQPTILDGVTEEMQVASEELLGPVLPVMRVPDVRAALHMANGSRYGLQCSVFSRNIDRAMYIARQLQVGTVQINGRPTRGPDHFPSHGVKESGMGSLGANHSILAMTRARTIVLNLRDQHP